MYRNAMSLYNGFLNTFFILTRALVLQQLRLPMWLPGKRSSCRFHTRLPVRAWHCPESSPSSVPVILRGCTISRACNAHAFLPVFSVHIFLFGIFLVVMRGTYGCPLWPSKSFCDSMTCVTTAESCVLIPEVYIYMHTYFYNHIYCSVRNICK